MVQRERTGRLTIHDFTRYFHLPIEKAAEGLNVCPTVVKKICRKHGVERWPYRKFSLPPFFGFIIQDFIFRVSIL